MERTQAALEAIKTPPSCISSFAYEALPLQPDDLGLAVDFALACKDCAAKTFRVYGFPVVAPTPSPHYGISPGETFFQPPHRIECVSCGAGGPLFDVRTQGYDGVLNGGGPYVSGTDGEKSVPGRFSLAVTACYNIEREELLELAEEAAVNPSDLFDWFTIVGTPIDDGEKIEFSYECA